jgi:hypothetical protein
MDQNVETYTASDMTKDLAKDAVRVAAALAIVYGGLYVSVKAKRFIAARKAQKTIEN